MKKTNAAAAAAAGALVTAGLAVSWRDGHRFVVRHYQISSSKICENIRIVFLSDLHSQVYGKKKDPDGPNGPLLRAIRSLNPDAVMIGGDMIVAKDAAYNKPGWKEVPLDLIEKLAKEFPVYFAEGNHEAQLASERLEGRYLRQYLEYHEEAERLGAIRVHNRSVVLHGGIRLYGLDLDSETFRKFLPYHLCKEQVGNSFRSMRTGEQIWCCPGISMEGSSDWDRRDRDFCLRTGTFSRIIQEGSTGFEEKTERRPRWF